MRPLIEGTHTTSELYQQQEEGRKRTPASSPQHRLRSALKQGTGTQLKCCLSLDLFGAAVTSNLDPRVLDGTPRGYTQEVLPIPPHTKKWL